MFNGVNLKEMEASEMVDVLHYLFEDDSNYSTAEQAEAQSSIRTNIYSTMYGTTYKYQIKSSKSREPFDPESLDFAPEDDASMADIKPFNPKKAPTKSYIPPTTVNEGSRLPFGSALDAPMN